MILKGLTIGIANDHAGTEYKTRLYEWLHSLGAEVVNFGTDSTESMDYTDVAHPLAEAVQSGRVQLGIALCGTGNGMAITLNKHKGIRAGLAWNKEVGALVKQHNNANILVLPARFVSFETAQETVLTYLESSFEGGRHQRRIDKMDCA